jgi:microcystin-dependent protein
MTITITIDFECPRWLRRSVAVVGVPLLVLGASTTVLADVSVPYSFASGQTVKAGEMNANFEALRVGINNAVPAGTIVAYGGATPPDGWLLCDGSSLTQAAFPRLFSAIGTAFGNTAGVGGSFNLPDLRGRFVRGVAGDVATRDPDAAVRPHSLSGGNAGNKVGSFQDSATATPKSAAFSASGGAHIHDLGLLGGKDFAVTAGAGAHLGTLTDGWTTGPGGGASDGGHQHTVSGGDKETRPSNVYVNFIIKH